MSELKGQVYIVCFDKPYLNKTTGQLCMHYIGFSNFLGLRIAHHRNGTGSKFLKAVNDAGITYIVSTIFNHVDRDFERSLKKRKKTKFYCPRCTEKPYKVKGYIEPQAPQKRSYKVQYLLGKYTVITNVIIPINQLLERLAKRFRVGEWFILNGKSYTRVNKRYHKKYFDIKVEVETSQPLEKKIKDLAPTDMFRFQEYLLNSQREKSEKCVEEHVPKSRIQDFDEIPF